MRPGLVPFLDWLAIACFVTTGAIYLSGGLVIMEGERRCSLPDPTIAPSS